jgi:hypothetical protein
MTWIGALLVAAVQWTCDAALTALFTPARADLGRYEVCVTPSPIDVVAAETAGGRVHLAAIETLNPFDAFGAAGPYDRAALARLYGGRQVRIARGWTERGDQFESVTLVSPHPDRTLSRLEPGTMAIRLRLIRRGL